MQLTIDQAREIATAIATQAVDDVQEAARIMRKVDKHGRRPSWAERLTDLEYWTLADYFASPAWQATKQLLRLGNEVQSDFAADLAFVRGWRE